MKEFILKHKVFITGLLAAIALVLQQYVGTEAFDTKVALFAAFMAGLGFLADQWKGQALSFLGIIGNMAYVFIQVHDAAAPFSWQQFILQSILAIIALAAKPPEPLEKK